MTELENSEKEYIRNLSENYKDLHSRIGEVEGMMEDFSKKARELLRELESKREDEKRFLSALSKKYGQGSIDVFTLSWKKEENDGRSEPEAK